jgi:hypothetical protein
MEHERGAFKVNHQGVGISDQIGPIFGEQA